MSEFNQAKYTTAYIKANIQRVELKLSKLYDMDIIEHINAQPNKQGYLKDLIREDIERRKTKMEKIMEKLISVASTYAAEDYELFEAELSRQPWMEDYTEAEDGEVCTEAEIERINEILRRAWHDAHQKRFYYVERDAIDGEAAWDTFGGIFATEVEAMASAEADWRHLTPAEQSRVRITVYYAIVPGDVELDEAMDYIYEANCGGYVAATIEKGE